MLAWLRRSRPNAKHWKFDEATLGAKLRSAGQISSIRQSVRNGHFAKAAALLVISVCANADSRCKCGGGVHARTPCIAPGCWRSSWGPNRRACNIVRYERRRLIVSRPPARQLSRRLL